MSIIILDVLFYKRQRISVILEIYIYIYNHKLSLSPWRVRKLLVSIYIAVYIYNLHKKRYLDVVLSFYRLGTEAGVGCQ